MKIWKKLSLMGMVMLMAFCTCFGLTGCGEKDYNTIELNQVTHSIFYAPLYVAMNKGYFQEEGLKVNLSTGGGSDTSMNALLTNSADIILAGPETAVYTDQEGVGDKPMVFGQLTACDGSFIVSKEQNDDFHLSDLVGETIIGGRKGGLPAMTLEYVIKEAGLEIGEGEGKVNLRTDVAFNLTASTWENEKSVKYCTLFEPTATTMENNEKGYVVSSVGKLSGSIPYTCFIAKQSYLKDHNDVATKFIKAVAKGYRFIADNVKTNSFEIAKALKPSFDGSTENELAIAVTQYMNIHAWNEGMVLESKSFDRLMDVMISAGVIKNRSEWSKVVDNTIVNSLLAA